MRPRTLDHVAYWLADRDAIAEFAAAHLGMHVIERTDRFTLVGADARRGKLTLFAAEGPRERGALEHVAFRVAATRAGARAAARPGSRSSGRAAARRTSTSPRASGSGSSRPTPTSTTTSTTSPSARPTRRRLPPRTRPLGFAAAAPGPSGAPRVEVGGAWIEFHPGDPGTPERPLLNHVAVLVDSVDEHLDAARDLGIEVDDVVDAPNTIAAFLRGPEHVRVEYVEHKPTFSLT